MRDTIVKADWLTALACPAMAWHKLRADPIAPNEAERFRMQQGQEIGALARTLYPTGTLITGPVEITQGHLADAEKQVFFEATVLAAPFVAKADILRRWDGAWHILEVKSAFSDSDRLEELIDDLTYTVMVFRRAGLPVVQASLVLLSRSFRFGDSPDRLFDIVNVTHPVMHRVGEFEGIADTIAKTLFQEAPTRPTLISACRECAFFDDKCLGAGIPHSVLEIPGLHQNKLKRLSTEGIVDLSRVPNDLELNERQHRARDAALSGQSIVDPVLSVALATIKWPCHYLDFETVATALPLYEGHRCHQQVLTQFSIHRLDGMFDEPRHSEYLADATRDCQRDVAEALIAALGTQGSIVVYSGFERTRLKALREAFPDLEVPLRAIAGRLVDLLSFVMDYVSHPDFKGSFSIKRVLPVLVPDLSYSRLDIRDGDTAITRFAQMARREITGSQIELTRLQLLEYCRLDTLAMVRLHEKLHQISVLSATSAGGTQSHGQNISHAL